MTEDRWNDCTDPIPMLEWLRGKASERKMRLYACACCRLVWSLLVDDRSRTAVETAERVADGLIPLNEAREAFSGACTASRFVRRLDDSSETVLRLRRSHDPDHLWWAAATAAFAVGNGVGEVENHENQLRGTRLDPIRKVKKSQLLRELFGNPFHPLSPLPPSLVTPLVVTIAQRAYDDRDFASLPVLANALEESSCTDAVLLQHLRGEGSHVRGCFVLDLVLGSRDGHHRLAFLGLDAGRSAHADVGLRRALASNRLMAPSWRACSMNTARPVDSP